MYPILPVSLAGKLAKMTECMEVLPAPEYPMRSIFFILAMWIVINQIGFLLYFVFL